MKINRNNYEPFFIDYLEGNLDKNMVDDFLEFLTANPDLKEELLLFEPVAIEPVETVFSKKELLLKQKYDLEAEFNQAAIAHFEGDLPDGEKEAFENYLATHPEKSADLALIARTKLVADENIVFKGKNSLYKNTLPKTILLWGSRVAAVLVLAISVYLFVQRNENTISADRTIEKTENQLPGQTNTISAPGIHQQQKNEVAVAQTETHTKTDAGFKQNIAEVQADETEAPKPHETIVNEYRHEEILATLQPVMASIQLSQPDLSLETMYITPPGDTDEERLLVDRIKEKTGIGNLSLDKIAKAGLNLFTSISNEKFTYQTDNKGKVTEVSFDSRLLAFSIPTTVRTNVETGE